MISPISPIYKTPFRKQPDKNGSSQKRKQKILFKNILDKEISVELGSKISVRI